MSVYAPIPPQPTPDWRAIRTLPIRDNEEPLVPASLAPERVLVRPRYFVEGLPGALPECFVREGLWERLLQAADALPHGYRLVLFDAWRPERLQRWLFERCAAEFRGGDADADAAAARAEAFVARPMRARTNPPFHLTGGAVDLSVADECGRLLDMGTTFDATVPASRTRHFEAAGDAHIERVRRNRRLLYHVMIDAGFANLATEWWHFDYGDQLWAWSLGAAHALYGAAQPPFRWGEPG